LAFMSIMLAAELGRSKKLFDDFARRADAGGFETHRVRQPRA
jgi:hypothetical protein